MLKFFLAIGIIFFIGLVMMYLWKIIEYIYYKFVKKDAAKLETIKPMNVFKSNSKDVKENSIHYFLLLFGFIGMMTLIIPYTPFGVEKIGHVLEKNEYEAYYHAELESYNSNINDEVIVLIECNRNWKIPSYIHADNKVIEIWSSEDITGMFGESIIIEDKLSNKYSLTVFNEKVSAEKIKRLGLD